MRCVGSDAADNFAYCSYIRVASVWIQFGKQAVTRRNEMLVSNVPFFAMGFFGAAFLPKAHLAANMDQTNESFDLGSLFAITIVVPDILNACCARDEFACLCLCHYRYHSSSSELLSELSTCTKF